MLTPVKVELTKFLCLLAIVGILVEIQPENIDPAILKIRDETLESFAEKLAQYNPQLADFINNQYEKKLL